MALEDRHQDDLSSEQKRPIKIPLRLKIIATLPKNNPLSTWTKKTLKGYWWQLRCRSRCKASRAKGGFFDALLETWNFKFEFVPEKKCLAKFQPSTPTLRQTESSPSTVACEKWSIVVGSGYMAPKKQIGGIRLWRGVLKVRHGWIMSLCRWYFEIKVIKARAVISAQKQRSWVQILALLQGKSERPILFPPCSVACESS